MKWKSIPGYEGIYEASDTGLIRSAKNKTTSSKKFPKRIWQQRILKMSKRYRHIHDDTYDFMVTLWKDNKPRKYLVSRLIAATFLENNLNSSLTVNHKDGDAANNRVDNLEWLSRSDNIKYGFENGQYHFCKSISVYSGSRKLKARSYAEMDKLLGQYRGYTSRAIMAGQNKLKSKSGCMYTLKTGGGD